MTRTWTVTVEAVWGTERLASCERVVMTDDDGMLERVNGSLDLDQACIVRLEVVAEDDRIVAMAVVRDSASVDRAAEEEDAMQETFGSGSVALVIG